MLSLLALLRFSLTKSREWSTAQLVSSTKLQNSAHITPLLFDLHWLPISSQIQYKIALSCFHIVSGSSSIPLWVASSLFSFSFSSFSLIYSDFPCPKSVQEDSRKEILSVYRTCPLELSSFLCQACHITPLFQVKTENLPLLFCLLIHWGLLRATAVTRRWNGYRTGVSTQS